MIYKHHLPADVPILLFSEVPLSTYNCGMAMTWGGARYAGLWRSSFRPGNGGSSMLGATLFPFLLFGGLRGFGLSSIMNSLINDVFERIAGEAVRLCRYNKRRCHRLKKATLSFQEIQTLIATRLIFPGELAKHAVSEGTKAALEKWQQVVAVALRQCLNLKKLILDGFLNKISEQELVLDTLPSESL
eukprot:g17037.t1